MAVSPIHWLLLGHTYAVELGVCAPSENGKQLQILNLLSKCATTILYGFMVYMVLGLLTLRIW